MATNAVPIAGYNIQVGGIPLRETVGFSFKLGQSVNVTLSDPPETDPRASSASRQLIGAAISRTSSLFGRDEAPAVRSVSAELRPKPSKSIAGSVLFVLKVGENACDVNHIRIRISGLSLSQHACAGAF